MSPCARGRNNINLRQNEEGMYEDAPASLSLAFSPSAYQRQKGAYTMIWKMLETQKRISLPRVEIARERDIDRPIQRDSLS